MTTFISYTPKSASAIIVQVEPELKVTAMFEDSEKTIKVVDSSELEDFYENHCDGCDLYNEHNCEGYTTTLERGDCEYFSIDDIVSTDTISFKAPRHFMTVNFDSKYFGDSDQVKIFAYTKYGMSTGKLNAVPYLIANVYDDGRICWGENFPGSTLNLRTLYNTFWNSSFNNDLVPNDEDGCDQTIHCWLSEVNYQNLKRKEEADDYAYYIKGKQNIIHTKPSEIEGFFFSDDAHMVNIFNKHLTVYTPYDGKTSRIVVGWLKKETLRLSDRLAHSYYIDVFGQKFDYDTQRDKIGDCLNP